MAHWIRDADLFSSWVSVRFCFPMLLTSRSLTPARTHSRSDRIQIYITTEEPTESELNFLAVPYTRWVPNDELTLPLTLAELVSHTM